MAFAVRIAFSLLLLAALPAFADDPPPPKPDPETEELQKLINTGAALIQQGHVGEALSQAIDPAVSKSDTKVAAEHRKIYTARTPPEMLFYLAKAAADHQEAIALPGVWSESYFIKGYVLNGTGNLAEARTYLQRAIDMAPMNAQYLSEMGNLESKEKHWDEALKFYLKSEEAANAISPANLKTIDLGRALRGEGFVYVEMNRLDDAEKAYRHSLTIDQNDQRSARELQYVLTQKAKQTGAPATTPPSQQQAGSPMSPALMNAIVNFGRANYFRAVAKQRHCETVNAAMLISIDDRFEKARQKLAAQFGEAVFPLDKPVSGPISDGGCDTMTLNAYSTHVREIEGPLGAAAN